MLAMCHLNANRIIWRQRLEAGRRGRRARAPRMLPLISESTHPFELCVAAIRRGADEGPADQLTRKRHWPAFYLILNFP